MTDVTEHFLDGRSLAGGRSRAETMRSIQAKVERLFREYGSEFEKLKTRAEAVASAVETSGRFVERHTSVVCPECFSVCCINRHSYLELVDMVCIYALGERPPVYKTEVADVEPCQFLGEKGCILRRSLRPHRCNWYFCTPLLEHIQTAHAHAYRAFIDGLRDINERRGALLAVFLQCLEEGRI